MKLIRIQLSGPVDAYVNQDHVASIEAQGEKRTVVSLSNGKVLDIDEAVDKVAILLQRGPGAGGAGAVQASH